jgi:hypothetical protein
VQAVKAIIISNVLSLASGLTSGQVLCDPRDIPMQKPVKLTQVRGTIVDKTGAVIRNVRVEIRKQTGKHPQKVDSLQTNAVG